MKRSISRTGIGSIYPAVILVISLAFLPPAVLADDYTFITLERPSTPGSTYAFGINDSGQVVGNGFLYSGGVFTDLVTGMPPGQAAGAEAYGINNSGQVAGTCYIGASDYGFIYSGGTFNWFNIGGADSMQAFGINDSGQIAGWYYHVVWEPAYLGNWHGFIYSNGTFTILDCPSSDTTYAVDTYAQGINNKGQVVGYTGDYYGLGVAHGFIYNDGAFTTFDVPFAVHTYAEGINNKGQITGYYTDSANHHHGFIYSNGVFTTIDVPSAVDTYAFGINDSGQIVGWYLDGTGSHGFIATPVVKTVRIDILPLLPNIIPLWPNWGIIPVTIFSTKDFNAPKKIDPQSLTFGDTGDQDSFAFCDPFNLDINRDGYRDLTCYFQKQYAGFRCGDTQGILKGTTMDGTLIRGTDSVRIFPCK